MRRTLGTLLLILLLSTSVAACGDESADDTATGPTTTARTSASEPGEPTNRPGQGEAIAFTRVALVSGTAAGGAVSERAVALGDAGALGDFTEQFTSDSFGSEVAAKAAGAAVPDGQALIGAVVSIGCDVPPGVSVTDPGDGLAIVPMKVVDPLQECFAPVTTVALVLVASGRL